MLYLYPTRSHLFTRFFCKQHFDTLISNTRLKLVKNRGNAKQHPEAELVLFETFSHSSSSLSLKNNITYSKKVAKNQICLQKQPSRGVLSKRCCQNM